MFAQQPGHIPEQAPFPGQVGSQEELLPECIGEREGLCVPAFVWMRGEKPSLVCGSDVHWVRVKLEAHVRQDLRSPTGLLHRSWRAIGATPFALAARPAFLWRHPVVGVRTAAAHPSEIGLLDGRQIGRPNGLNRIVPELCDAAPMFHFPHEAHSSVPIGSLQPMQRHESAHEGLGRHWGRLRRWLGRRA